MLSVAKTCLHVWGWWPSPRQIEQTWRRFAFVGFFDLPSVLTWKVSAMCVRWTGARRLTWVPYNSAPLQFRFVTIPLRMVSLPYFPFCSRHFST